MLFIKQANEEQIPVIQDLAQKTWVVAYASILPEAQLDYMLNLFYSTDSLKEQMKKGHTFILAMDEGVPVGFASYGPKELRMEETISPIPLIYRLHKIYIAPGQQGKGIGRLLLDHIVREIGFKGATTIELNVNRSNAAIGFYKQAGFTITREEDIDIGNGYFMNDYVMEKKLKAEG